MSFPIGVLDALIAAGHAKSKGEGRRLIAQGGVKLGEARVDDPDQVIPGPCLLWKGKKQAVRLTSD